MGDELDTTVKALVTEALFKAIDEKKREELLKAAIGSLLKEEGGHYGPKTSKLQDCFNQAAYEVAREIVREKMTKDEAFKGAIGTVVTEALNKVWAGDKREDLVNIIAASVTDWMTPKQR